MRLDEESRSGGLADSIRAFPPHLTRKREQSGRQGNHLLACMTANSEPSNQSFEVDREATVCFASRRLFLRDAVWRHQIVSTRGPASS